MIRPVIVRRLAESDLQAAARWYEAERTELGRRFLDDVDRTFQRIRERPMQFPSVAVGVRRALLDTFPYAVYFGTKAADESLVILAVLHMRRRPAAWQRRR